MNAPGCFLIKNGEMNARISRVMTKPADEIHGEAFCQFSESFGWTPEPEMPDVGKRLQGEIKRQPPVPPSIR